MKCITIRFESLISSQGSDIKGIMDHEMQVINDFYFTTEKLSESIAELKMYVNDADLDNFCRCHYLGGKIAGKVEYETDFQCSEGFTVEPMTLADFNAMRAQAKKQGTDPFPGDEFTTVYI